VGTDKETLGGNANEKFVYLLQNIPYKKERAGLSTGVMKKKLKGFILYSYTIIL